MKLFFGILEILVGVYCFYLSRKKKDSGQLIAGFVLVAFGIERIVDLYI